MISSPPLQQVLLCFTLMNRLPCFAKQLIRLLIHADHRVFRVVWLLVQIQQATNATLCLGEITQHLRRCGFNSFFRSRNTDSCEMLSIIRSSTTLSAKSQTVHFSSPFRGFASAERNDLCLNITGYLRLNQRGLTLLAADGRVQALSSVGLADRMHSLCNDKKHTCNLFFAAFLPLAFIGGQ